MAKVKKLLPESKQVKPLIYTERKDNKDGFTHNVRMARIKSKRKKTR